MNCAGNGKSYALLTHFVKLLKIKVFNSQKSLDTPDLGLIRFRQKVLTDIHPPLELFSLEREGRPRCRAAFSFTRNLILASLSPRPTLQIFAVVHSMFGFEKLVLQNFQPQ